MKRIFTIFFLSTITLVGYSQSPFGKSPWEVGIHAGHSVMVGDLGGGGSDVSPFSPDNYDFTSAMGLAGIHARYKLHPRFAINGSFQGGYLSSNDKNSTSESLQKRNLNHRTTIYELAITPEFYFIKDGEVAGMRNKFSAYIYGGISLIYFNPKMKLDDEYLAIHDWNLEGKDFSRITAGVPMGIGVKYALNRKWTLGYKVNMVYTFTDYLDGVSDSWAAYEDIEGEDAQIAYSKYNATEGKTRGNPDTKDMYMTHYLSLTYRFDMGEVRRSDFYHFFDFWLSRPGRKKF